MPEQIYRKVGRKYVPIQWYDPAYMNGMPEGTHLVMVRGNGTHVRYKIEPAAAPVLAAALWAKDALTSALLYHTSGKMRVTQTDEKTQRAVKAYQDIAGSDKHVVFDVPSVNDAVDAFILDLAALVGQPEKLKLVAEYGPLPKGKPECTVTTPPHRYMRYLNDDGSTA